METAIAALGAEPGIIGFGPGTYRLNSPHELKYPGQYFSAPGFGVTTLDYRGAGACLRIWDSTADPTGNEVPGRGGGILGGLTINGINNPHANAVGLMVGDLVGAQVDYTRITGFVQPGDVGFLLHNRYSWTEYSEFNVHSDYNTNCIVIEASPDHPHPFGPTSFSYCRFNFGFAASANQNGVWIRGGVTAVGLDWDMPFNCEAGTTNEGVAFIIGSDYDEMPDIDPETGKRLTAGFEYNHIQASMNFAGETTVGWDQVGHRDFMFGPRSSWRGSGSLIFNDFGEPDGWQAGNSFPWWYQMNFAGRVDTPSFGHYARFEGTFATIGDPVRSSAMGDDARYILTQENPWGGYPVIAAKVSRNEMVWDPELQESIPADVSVGIAIQSKLASDETRKSLITLDGVNVVESLRGLGDNVRYAGHYDDWTYARLATLPPGETDGATLQIVGRLGGFETNNIAAFDMLISNRNFVEDPETHEWGFDNDHIGALISAKGQVWQGEPIWDVADLVAYRQEDGSTIFYFKLKNYYTYNLIVSTERGVIDWKVETIDDSLWGSHGNPPPPPLVPTGTLLWALSEQPQFVRDEPFEIEGQKRFSDLFAIGTDTANAVEVDPAAEGAITVYTGFTAFGQPTGFAGNRIQQVGTPEDFFDASTKGYVDDSLDAGIPWGPTADGVKGQTAADSDYLYRCVATNSWKRTPLSTW